MRTAANGLRRIGIGGFACGNVSGTLTRRYHSDTCGATKPPLGRVNTIAKSERALSLMNLIPAFASNQYPGTVDPTGFKFITRFRLDPFPVWTYSIDGSSNPKKIFMVHGSNATVCRWRVFSAFAERDIRLEIRPLAAFVDHHHLQQQNGPFHGGFDEADGIVSIKPYNDLPAIYLGHNGTGVTATGYWYKNFELAIEQERGFDFNEDLFQPFEIEFDLAKPADLIVSTQAVLLRPPQSSKVKIRRRQQSLISAKLATDLERQLVLAADQFIVKRGSGNTVIAGYPWFSDSGRDTMIRSPAADARDK